MGGLARSVTDSMSTLKRDRQPHSGSSSELCFCCVLKFLACDSAHHCCMLVSLLQSCMKTHGVMHMPACNGRSHSQQAFEVQAWEGGGKDHGYLGQRLGGCSPAHRSSLRCKLRINSCGWGWCSCDATIGAGQGGSISTSPWDGQDRRGLSWSNERSGHRWGLQALTHGIEIEYVVRHQLHKQMASGSLQCLLCITSCYCSHPSSLHLELLFKHMYAYDGMIACNFQPQKLSSSHQTASTSPRLCM